MTAIWRCWGGRCWRAACGVKTRSPPRRRCASACSSARRDGRLLVSGGRVTTMWKTLLISWRRRPAVSRFAAGSCRGWRRPRHHRAGHRLGQGALVSPGGLPTGRATALCTCMSRRPSGQCSGIYAAMAVAAFTGLGVAADENGQPCRRGDGAGGAVYTFIALVTGAAMKLETDSGARCRLWDARLTSELRLLLFPTRGHRPVARL